MTGERLVWERAAAETNGAYTLFDTQVEPGGAVAAVHRHPFQTEIFTVLEGRLGVAMTCFGSGLRSAPRSSSSR